MNAKQLDALAKDLRLSVMQRGFADRLAADPERNKRRAAIAAGASPRSAHVTASGWLKLPKVQKYLAAVTGAALELAKRDRELADLGETLEILTFQARAKLGDFLAEDGSIDVKKVRAAPAGVVKQLDTEERAEGRGEDRLQVLARKLRIESSQGAAEKLLRYHLGAYAPERAQPVNVNLWMGVVQKSNGDFRAAAVRVLGTGNGHGAD